MNGFVLSQGHVSKNYFHESKQLNSHYTHAYTYCSLMNRLVSLLLECKIVKRRSEKRATKVANPTVAAYQVISFIAPACRL